MLSKWMTEILVLLAVGLGVACVCLWLHEHDICPLKAIKKVMRKVSFIGLCVLALWAVPLIQYGSTKGGTNNVQMVVGPGGGLQPLNSPGSVTNNQQQGFQGGILPSQGGMVGDPAPVTDEWSNFAPITSTNTTRTITGDDFRRGFVMSRVGTDEVFDFSAPSNAVVCTDWRAFGAATEANVKCKV